MSFKSYFGALGIRRIWEVPGRGFGSLSWFWSCKEHPYPLSPIYGLWLGLEDSEGVLLVFGILVIIGTWSRVFYTALSKAPNQDLKDMDVLCTFKIKIESQKLEHRCIKEQGPYPNKDENVKPQSGTSSILQSPKPGLKGHGCSLHLQNQDREPKFKTWVYQRPVTISKSISGCQTPVRTL